MLRLSPAQLALAEHEVQQRLAASSLPTQHQVTDPNNQPTPQDDEFNPEPMFPIDPAFAQQWITGPDGAQPRGQKEGAARHHPANPDGQSKCPSCNSNDLHFGRSEAWCRHCGTTSKRSDLISAASLHVAAPGTCGNCDHPAHEGRCSGCQCTYSGSHLIHDSMRHQADLMTRPHQTTDDFAAPFNSAQTSPQPWSQNEGNGDFRQGFKDGQDDARAGERPTFMDNSSHVSPYVSGYAEGYASDASRRFDPVSSPDVPRSMGGDAGQAQNAEEAARSFQVSKASLQHQAAGIDHSGCVVSTQNDKDAHTHEGKTGKWRFADEPPGTPLWPEHGHAGGPAPRRAREAAVPMHSLDRTCGCGRKKTLNGKCSGCSLVPGQCSCSKLGSSRLAVSAAFVPREASRSADFRKGYGFGRQWDEGWNLVALGSAEFEAGLYAGMTDNPGRQAAWVAKHRAQAPQFPYLGDRLRVHASFTRKFARQDERALVRGLYIQAATSTDLITDGPGTSPDPMGSTPLNGPGTPPPMGGGTDPARSGGPSPYQGAPPGPGQPVAPDDVMGQPQDQPGPHGPPVGYSGPDYGLGLLAPAAPNRAAQPGYSNQAADEGNPHHRQAAFRARVQENLALMSQVS